MTSDSNAIASTAGTNTPEIRSATLAIGAFVADASLTIWMIFANVVSSPTRVAFAVKNPEALMVAAVSSSPTLLSTGMLSPEIADSSTALSPERITPSTGMLSPGRTTKISSTFTCSIGTLFSSPSIRMVACFGANSISPRNASVVLPLEYASSILPTVISVSIMAADSK